MYQVVSTYNDDKIIQFLVGKHIQKSEWNHRLMSQVFCWPNVFPLQQTTDFASKTPLISSNQKDPKSHEGFCNTSSDPKLQTKSYNLENTGNKPGFWGAFQVDGNELNIGNSSLAHSQLVVFFDPKNLEEAAWCATAWCNSLVLQDEISKSTRAVDQMDGVVFFLVP